MVGETYHKTIVKVGELAQYVNFLSGLAINLIGKPTYEVKHEETYFRSG